MIDQVLNNRYRITAALGQGAMGTVYRATDIQTGEEVALKLIASELTLDLGMLERFRREGESLRQLRHRSVVGFVDMFDFEGKHVIVMEYVAGGSLHSLLRQGALPLERARQIALDLCDALISAHRLNIIHRDLKPENVLMAQDGTPKLTDFGVARLLSEGTRLTGTGTQVGTPYYMSPEAWEGQPLDTQADIWSLGVMLFEMLAGEVPFSGDTMAAVMTKVLMSQQPPDLRRLRPEAPPAVVKIIQRMLQHDKSKRYTSMREVALDLERVANAGSAGPAADAARRQDKATGAALATPPAEPVRRGKELTGKMVVVGLLAGVLVLGGLIGAAGISAWMFNKSAAARRATQAAPAANLPRTATMPATTARPTRPPATLTLTPLLPTATPPATETAAPATSATEPTPAEISLAPQPTELWAASKHANVNDMAFNNWNDIGAVPTACAKCHTPAGYTEFIRDGQIITDVAVGPGHVITCDACHSDTAAALNQVAFPSGEVVQDLGPEARCLVCHQGRQSTTGLNQYLSGYAGREDTPSDEISFRNTHYYMAGATLYGTEVKGGYEYTGQAYVGRTAHPLNKCTDCHDAHRLTVNREACMSCHIGVSSFNEIRWSDDNTDWNGNGDVTEPMAQEIAMFQERLYVAILEYAETKAGQSIVYDGTRYPYYFLDANRDGQADQDAQSVPVRYPAWTPRLLKASYNYQFSQKEPAAYAHNARYVMQVLYDSIKDLGGSARNLVRPNVK